VARTDTVSLNGRKTTYQVNTQTLTGAIVTPAGRRESVRFDSAGRTVFDSATGLAALRYVYDSTGRVLSTTRGSRAWQYVYDLQGRLERSIDPGGRAHRFEYDGAGRVVARIRTDGTIAHYGYNAAGDLLTIAPPGRPAHQFQYTDAGLPRAYVPPPVPDGPTATQFALDSAGRLSIVALPGGDSIKIAYDADGRRTSLQTTEGLYTFGFDPTNGRPTTASSPSGATISYQYDGRLPTRFSVQGPFTGSTSLTYDSDFRVATERVNDAPATSVTYGYDSDGLVVGVGMLGVTRNAGNGLVSATSVGSVSTSFIRDSLGQAKQVTTSFSGSPLFEEVPTRDVSGRITRVVETVLGQARTTDLGYDSFGRLTTVARDGQLVATYEYDANGNRTRLTGPSGVLVGVVDDQDRLLSYGAATYAYELTGARRSRVNGSGTTTYRHDSFRNLTGVTTTDGTQIDYLLDADHRRISTIVGGTVEQRFIYGSARGPIADLDAGNQVVTRYVYGTRSSVPDYFTRGGQTYAIVVDHLGSVRLVVNVSSGVVEQRLEYDEYGRVTTDTRPGFQPFGYAGGLYDTRTGLVHFGARDYDPEAGRWLSKDPALFDGGSTNLYEYASGDPINNADPSGYEGTLAEMAVTGAIGNVLTGFVVARLTGKSYSAGDAFRDAAIGAVTGPLAAKWFGGLFGVAKKAQLLASGRVALYQGFDLATGELVYVGITNELERRAAEHLLEKAIRITAIEGLENLSIHEARAVEQALIEFYGGKAGGRLLNLINSISPLRPDYAELVAHGRDLLRLVGFPI
jgi:RHS repeat-associated protein